MCTLEKRHNIFFLTLTSTSEHRLNPTLIHQIRTYLARIKSESISQPGSILITKAEGKFFSNGFDLAWASANGGPAKYQENLDCMGLSLKALIAEMISLPLPTIAAVTGHAAAAGMMLALSHDYLIMRKDRGVLYMSELDLGMILPDYFTALMRSKFKDAKVLREVVLKAKKVKAEEGMEMGIVDEVGETAEETVEKGIKLGEQLGKRGWNGEVYAELRKDLLKDISEVLGLFSKTVVIAKL